MAVALDQPALVVGLLERQEGQAQLLDLLEPAEPEQFLRQGADEPLGTTVALGSADESRGALGAEEADLALEVLAHVLAAVVVADAQALCDAEPSWRH